jgi:hypothetical protein
VTGKDLEKGGVPVEKQNPDARVADTEVDRFCVEMREGNPMLGAFVIDREGVLEKQHFAQASSAIGAAVMLNKLDRSFNTPPEAPTK